MVVGYWASLAWRRLAFTWQSVVLYQSRQPPVRRSSLAASPPPEVGADKIAWRAPALGCEIAVGSRQRPIEERLLDDSTGVVEWRAEAPAAVLSVKLSGFPPVKGPGYAERILLTVPPWRLPIRELRWGRWLDEVPNRSVVWIDWRGESQRTWVFVDGKIVSPAVVTDEGVSAGAVNLVVGERRVLETLAFSQVAETIPSLLAAVPKAFLALRQTRWCSDATLQDADAAPTGGRAIHEVVVFR